MGGRSNLAAEQGLPVHVGDWRNRPVGAEAVACGVTIDGEAKGPSLEDIKFAQGNEICQLINYYEQK